MMKRRKFGTDIIEMFPNLIVHPGEVVFTKGSNLLYQRRRISCWV